MRRTRRRRGLPLPASVRGTQANPFAANQAQVHRVSDTGGRQPRFDQAQMAAYQAAMHRLLDGMTGKGADTQHWKKKEVQQGGQAGTRADELGRVQNASTGAKGFTPPLACRRVGKVLMPADRGRGTRPGGGPAGLRGRRRAGRRPHHQHRAARLDLGGADRPRRDPVAGTRPAGLRQLRGRHRPGHRAADPAALLPVRQRLPRRLRPGPWHLHQPGSFWERHPWVPFATIFFAGALLSFDKMPTFGNATFGGGPRVGMTSSLTSHTAPMVDTSTLMGATPGATLLNISNVFIHFFRGYGALIVLLGVFSLKAVVAGRKRGGTGTSVVMIAFGFAVMNADTIAAAVMRCFA